MSLLQIWPGTEGYRGPFHVHFADTQLKKYASSISGRYLFPACLRTLSEHTLILTRAAGKLARLAHIAVRVALQNVAVCVSMQEV